MKTTGIEILTKAVEKAIAGGWNAEIRGNNLYVDGFDNATASYHGSAFPGDYNVIFNHDFAYALWGKEMVYFDDGSEMGSRPSYVEADSDSSPYYVPHGENYKYHLQQMVIADDPIKYLGKNI